MMIEVKFPQFGREILLLSLNVFSSYLLMEWRYRSGFMLSPDIVTTYLSYVYDVDTLYQRMLDTIVLDIQENRLHLPSWLTIINEKPFEYKVTNYTMLDFPSRKVYK